MKTYLSKKMLLVLSMSLVGSMQAAASSGPMADLEAFCDEYTDFLKKALGNREAILKESGAMLADGLIHSVVEEDINLKSIAGEFISKLLPLSNDIEFAASSVIGQFWLLLVQLQSIENELLKLCWENHPGCWPIPKTTELAAAFTQACECTEAVNQSLGSASEFTVGPVKEQIINILKSILLLDELCDSALAKNTDDDLLSSELLAQLEDSERRGPFSGK